MATFQTNEILDAMRSQKRNLKDRVQRLEAQFMPPRADKLVAYVLKEEEESDRDLEKIKGNLGSVESSSWIRYFPQNLVNEIGEITRDDRSWSDFENGMKQVVHCKRLMKTVYDTCAHAQAPIAAQEFFRSMAEREQKQIEHIGRRLSALEQGY